MMRSKTRKILLIIASAVFIICAAVIIWNKYPYWKNRNFYDKTAKEYTQVNEEYTEIPDEGSAAQVAPIIVDFAALKAVNEDVSGWIYCEGTEINYPVVQGPSNDTYLHTTYTGIHDFAGSIFVEEQNLRDFKDNNTIIYGHNMYDGSMFAGLGNWQIQSYFDEHPVMWLLTPEQDYKVVLFSAYVTYANNRSVYAIYRGTGDELARYIEDVRTYSYIYCDEQLDPAGRFLLLSTCTNAEGDKRSVIHGMLVPVDSVGGILK